MDLDVRLDELIGMNDTLIALVGESGSGKTAIANYLKDIYGLRILRSYTTRQKRADSNDDHCYISVEEYNKLDNKVAENCYNGNMYCATVKQCDESDVYVVDVPGLKMLKKNYKNKKVFAIYIDVPENTRVQRMKMRGDSNELIVSRMKNDKGKDFKDAKLLCDVTINNEFCLAMTTMAIVAEVNKFREKNNMEGDLVKKLD